eukprot:6755884-Lingulodinium_polyedra.AAC.1
MRAPSASRRTRAMPASSKCTCSPWARLCEEYAGLWRGTTSQAAARLMPRTKSNMAGSLSPWARKRRWPSISSHLATVRTAARSPAPLRSTTVAMQACEPLSTATSTGTVPSSCSFLRPNSLRKW